MRALTAIGLAGGLLAGCASVTSPPTSPTAIQIATAASDLKASGLSPGDYASIGVTLAQRNCADWFSSQVMNAQGTSFGASALSMIGGAASAVGAVGGPAGAGIGAGASLLASLLGQAQASFGAGSNPAAVYSLVQRVQQAWLEAMPTPLTDADAFALVEDFAQRCQLPGILTAVADAMHAATVTALPAPADARSLNRSATAPGRMRLPVVSIGPPRPFMLAQQPAHETGRPSDRAARTRLRMEHEAMVKAGGRNAYEGGPRELPPPVPRHIPEPPPAVVAPLPPPDRVQGQPIRPAAPQSEPSAPKQVERWKF